VSAAALLVELNADGVRLSLAGDDLRYQTRPGVSIAPYRDRILENKPALLRELLQREIVAAATAEPARFDRDAYDQLLRRWPDLQDQERAQAPDDGYVSRSPVEPSVPPAGWDGLLCAECPWPAFCSVLGPRGPHLPGGSCAAWPAKAALEMRA
jgi:hypothetical protein